MVGRLEKLSLYVIARAAPHLLPSASSSFGSVFNVTPLVFQMSDFGIRNMDQVAPVSNMYRGMLKVSPKPSWGSSQPGLLFYCAPTVLEQELDKPCEHRFNCQSIPTEFHRDVDSSTEMGILHPHPSFPTRLPLSIP